MKKSVVLVLSLFFMQSIYSNDSKVMVGYYPNWLRYPPAGRESKRPQFTPSMIDVKGSGLTHINYAFVRPYPNAVNSLSKDISSVEAEDNVKANLDILSEQDLNNVKTFRNMMTDTWADVDIGKPWNASEDVVAGSFKEFQDLKKKNPGLKTLASFGGWTLSNGFSAATKTADRRRKMATLMVNFVKKYGFNGVDIDWEYPGWKDHAGAPEDKANFVEFLKILSQKTKENGLLLTLAVASDLSKIQNGMDLPAIHSLVDWMSIMAYDYNGPWGQKYTGHNAPLFNDLAAPGGENPPSVNGTYNIAAALKFYLDAGVPKDKIVLGMPSYGRSFAGVKDDKGNGGLYGTGTLKPGIGTVEAGVVSLSDVENYLKNNSYKQYRDKVSGNVPYLYNQTTGDWVSYDDFDSLITKAHFAKEKGLRGAMFWQLESQKIYTNAIKGVSDIIFSK